MPQFRLLLDTALHGHPTGGVIQVLLGSAMARGGGARCAGVGGMDLVCGVTGRAWDAWRAGAPVVQPTGDLRLIADSRFLPVGLEEAEDLAARLMRAIVAAALADGHVTPDERALIDEAMTRFDLGAEARVLIMAELDAPKDAGRIAALSRKPEEAALIYAVSALLIGKGGPVDRAWLAELAGRLGIDPCLVGHLEATVAAIAMAELSFGGSCA